MNTARVMHRYGLTKAESLREPVREYAGAIFQTTNDRATRLIDALTGHLDALGQDGTLSKKGIVTKRHEAAVATHKTLKESYAGAFAKMGQDLERARKALPTTIPPPVNVETAAPFKQADTAYIVDGIRRDLRAMDPLEVPGFLKNAAKAADTQTLYAVASLSAFQRQRIIGDDDWGGIVQMYLGSADPEAFARVESIETALQMLTANLNMARRQIEQVSGVTSEAVDDKLPALAGAK